MTSHDTERLDSAVLFLMTEKTERTFQSQEISMKHLKNMIWGGVKVWAMFR